MVFWFLGFGPKSPIWRLLGLLAASVLASHFRRMLISKNHINPQLILPKMRFLAAHFGLKLAQNRVCSSKQKTSLAWVKLTFFAFLSIIKSIEIWCIARGAIWASRGSIRPHLGPKSTPNRSKIDPESIQHRPSKRLSFLLHADRLTACRSSYSMLFILSDVYRNDRQLESKPIILLHDVHIICRSSSWSSIQI